MIYPDVDAGKGFSFDTYGFDQHIPEVIGSSDASTPFVANFKTVGFVDWLRCVDAFLLTWEQPR